MLTLLPQMHLLVSPDCKIAANANIATADAFGHRKDPENHDKEPAALAALHHIDVGKIKRTSIHDPMKTSETIIAADASEIAPHHALDYKPFEGTRRQRSRRQC